MRTRSSQRGRLAVVSLIFLGLAFFWLVARLVHTRVSGGDVFPQYSTMRADPKGCKALYLALKAMPEREVTRNMTRWHKVRITEPTTVMAIGAADSASSFDESELLALLGWLDTGSRVVLTAPYDESIRRRSEGANEAEPDETDEDDQAKGEAPADEADGEAKAERAELDEDGLLGLEWESIERGKGEPIVSTRFPHGNWRGNRALILPKDGGGWVSEGTVDGHVVLASRRIGSGEILVAADSTFATNEGVWRDRRSAFLLSLIGDHPRIIMDERMLGTMENPGIMSLMRKLGLHGMVLGGAWILLLLVWQGLCPLVPPNAVHDYGIDEGGVTRGRDSSEGLVALLGRGLPPSRVLGYCIDLWRRSHEHGPAPKDDTLESARRLAATGSPGTLASAYLRIHNLLNQPSKPHPTPHHGSH